MKLIELETLNGTKFVNAGIQSCLVEECGDSYRVCFNGSDFILEFETQDECFDAIKKLNGESKLIKEPLNDLKQFVQEHKNTIYIISFALLLDHFVFNGAFRARLKSMVDSMLSKVEKSLKK